MRVVPDEAGLPERGRVAEARHDARASPGHPVQVRTLAARAAMAQGALFGEQPRPAPGVSARRVRSGGDEQGGGAQGEGRRGDGGRASQRADLRSARFGPWKVWEGMRSLTVR